MRKEPKRNIQSYQQGGHLNEFEFQKSQSEMAEESELPFTDETDKPNLTQAKRVAEVTAEAHRKVEKRKKRGPISSPCESTSIRWAIIPSKVPRFFSLPVFGSTLRE